jgi:hypothetical protein
MTDQLHIEEVPLPDCSCTDDDTPILTMDWKSIDTTTTGGVATSTNMIARAVHTATWCTRDGHDSHGSVVVFGGRHGGGGNDLNDMAFFDVATLKWSSELKAPASAVSSTTTTTAAASWPEPRSGHTAVAYGHRIYLFGGQSVTVTLATPTTDTKSSTTTKGKKKTLATPTQVETTSIYNDCWMFDMNRQRWLKLKPNTTKAGGIVPPQRNAHTATVVGKKMWILGGSDQNGPSNDVYSFHLGTLPLPPFCVR